MPPNPLSNPHGFDMQISKFKKTILGLPPQARVQGGGGAQGPGPPPLEIEKKKKKKKKKKKGFQILGPPFYEFLDTRLLPPPKSWGRPCFPSL